jgi:predicted PurR-regulated permease PerM
MGQKLQLHPLTVLFGVLAGAEVAGIIGVYLSIPVMAAARIFWRRWRAFQRASSVDIVEVGDLTPARDPNRRPVA